MTTIMQWTINPCKIPEGRPTGHVFPNGETAGCISSCLACLNVISWKGMLAGCISSSLTLPKWYLATLKEGTSVYGNDSTSFILAFFGGEGGGCKVMFKVNSPVLIYTLWWRKPLPKLSVLRESKTWWARAQNRQGPLNHKLSALAMRPRHLTWVEKGKLR